VILIAKNAFTLLWTLTDTATPPNPINNANVLVTMYQGRSAIDPDNIPGTPVAPLINVTLVYVPASSGVYQASQAATLDPIPLADGSYPSFTLVVDASVGGTPQYHHEEPIIVQTAVEANAVDLTTAAAVADEAMISNVTQKTLQILQDYVTGFSKAVLAETGIQSFSQPIQMNETRNGNGNPQMFVAMPPIINVQAVIVSGTTIPLAGAWPSWGYFVSDDRKSIYIRQAGSPTSFNWYPRYQTPPTPGFSFGIGNVNLQYWGGYQNVPSDLEVAARKMCAIYYKRKQTQDLQSQGETTAGAAATTRYRDWKVPPELDCIFKFYRKSAFV
jgi:hypothetical protein